MNESNPTGLCGIEFVEFSSKEPQKLHELFLAFGFSRVMRHKEKKIDLYKQNEIHFLLNFEEGSFGTGFAKEHGPCISSMGWRVYDEKVAIEKATSKGAKQADGDYQSLPSIYGIGDSLLYFTSNWGKDDFYKSLGFEKLDNPDIVEQKGFIAIDHLTNNVAQGTMQTWANYYKDIFGFTEVRYFDIRGAKTGLTSYALKSPCGSFCIPINEATDAKSQINEYLEEYKGPGVQHLAFLTHDILQSLGSLEGTDIETLDIDDDYYNEVYDRVPNVTENRDEIKKRNVLVDGDRMGYLLQIFTKNIIGPIFIEIIQRKNHYSFGEGNFGALFRSIERDQQNRGYLD